MKQEGIISFFAHSSCDFAQISELFEFDKPSKHSIDKLLIEVFLGFFLASVSGNKVAFALISIFAALSTTVKCPFRGVP